MKTSQPASGTRDDLLITKLKIPSLNTTIVRRNRLSTILQGAKDRPITLLVAPTGYGKTTLLVEWLSQTTDADWRSVWITLDPLDNTPIQFWSYVVLGLQRACPALRVDRQELLLYSLQPENLGLINPLINEIARIRQSIYLILDDYQVIQDESIHRGLQYLIEHQPSNLRLIIASRVAPPFHIARQRAQRRLVEINAQDLSFTYPETSLYLSTVMGFEINLDLIEKLHNATEGWIAGIQLAALSLKNGSDFDSYLDDFPAGQQQINNYLLEEVLDHQDAATRNFLLQTSILSDLYPALCDTILGQTGSQEMLRLFEQANLFITATDENRNCYRYHPLFAEALREILSQESPDLVEPLHRKAYIWLRENGYPSQAITHALAAGDIEIVADIIEESALNAVINDDLLTLAYWTKQFTPALLCQHPRLGVYDALAQFFLGRIDRVDGRLQIVEQLLERADEIRLSPLDAERIRWEMNALYTVTNSKKSSPEETIPRIQTLLREAPVKDSYFCGFLTNSLAITYDQFDDIELAISTFDRGCQFASAHHLDTGFVHSCCDLGRLKKVTGRLSASEQAYQQALEYAVRNDVHIGGKILALTGILQVAFERNEIERAHKLGDEILNQLGQPERTVLPWNYQNGIFTRLANYFLTTGDLQKGNFYFQKVTHNLGSMRDQGNPFLLDEYIDLQVRVWIMTGECSQGEQWLINRIKSFKGTAKTAMAEHIGLARIFLAQSQPDSALTWLAQIGPTAQKKGMGERQIVISILQAKAYHLKGNSDKAQRMIRRALQMAEPEGYIQCFANEGEAVKELLVNTLTEIQNQPNKLNREINPQYLSQLISACGEKSVSPCEVEANRPNVLSTVPPAERLSARESKILSLILEGKNVKEIAIGLMISTNTAKAHIRSIHRKMGVHSRQGVIQRAKELGLGG